jgi:hypothetical protein
VGYGARPAKESDALKLPKPLISHVLKAFEGPFETILVYAIKNTGKKPLVLSTEMIKKPSNNWAFLNVHEIKHSEQSIYIVSTPNIGN